LLGGLPDDRRRWMSLDTDSLERLVPDDLEPGDTTGQETLRLHLERYEFASRVTRGGRLLDIACGVGYGTRLITDRNPGVRQAIGVDVSPSTIAYGVEHYGNRRTEYLVADAMRFRDETGFDSIVSLETIEHLPDPAAFVAHLVSLLRPGGVFVASVPTTPSVDVNPHHLRDFTEASFRRLMEPHGLTEKDHLRQTQPVSVKSLLTRSESRMRDMRRNLPAYYLRHPGALANRLWATVRYGFTNRYITICWQCGP